MNEIEKNLSAKTAGQKEGEFHTNNDYSWYEYSDHIELTLEAAGFRRDAAIGIVARLASKDNKPVHFVYNDSSLKITPEQGVRFCEQLDAMYEELAPEVLDIGKADAIETR